MRLYDNATLDNYEEIKTLYPVWYRDVLEMDVLWKAFGFQLDDIRASLTQAVDNGFVWTADEPTIAKLEQFLYIPVNRSKPLVERKTLVASFSVGNGHIGEREIKEVIRIFTDGEIEVALVGGTVEISVTRELSDRFNLTDCLYILFKRLPAHLKLLFRDILKPILFENQNTLHFRGFGVHGRFFNRGQTEPVLLNGRRNLDGSWTLEQVFSGIAFERFSARTALLEREHLAAPVLSFKQSLARTEIKLRAESIHFSTQFYNNSDTERIILNGEHLLDGVWLLNQELRGVVMPVFALAVSIRVSELSKTSCIVFSTGAMKNVGLIRLESFGFAQRFQNKPSIMPCAVRFGLQARLTYSVRGSVTINSMYALDGDVSLDGSRKLNANIIKEEI